jgi:CHAD domain
VTWSGALAASAAVGLGLVVARAERERRAERAGRSRERERVRRFGLLSDEPAGRGMRRIALAQLDLAIELLRGESSDGGLDAKRVPPERAVHETRKALKRVRALLRLLEGELGTKRADRERAVLRDAAARLAGARDAEVLVSTLDALVARHQRRLGARRGVEELRADLERERLRASARTLGDGATRELVAEELAEVRARVASWKLPAKRSAAKLTHVGLEHIYRAGRSGRRRAGKRSAGPRTLHRWRKHVKDLRYAAEVLDVARVARRADGLGEMLGEEHDLMLLAERVRAHKRLKRRRKRTRRRLLRAIARRRRRLRERALREGEHLYARRPGRFLRKMRA